VSNLPATEPAVTSAEQLVAIALSLAARRRLRLTHTLFARVAALGRPAGPLPHYLEALQLLPPHCSYSAAQWRSLLEQAARIAEQLAALDVALVTLFCPDYPPLLAEIIDPPPLLYVRGARAQLAAPQLAVVGSRNSAQPALQLTQQWCQAMALAGVTITSGLAFGIDGAAHRGAVAAGRPTVAVMATGIDRLYPARHQRLAGQILEGGGALITEYPPGEAPLPANFPRRNRIISGLSLAVWVVEAAIKSGTLITARAALEQNRELLVLPGSVNNPLSRGCHLLLREGATLVESAAEIVAQLGANFLLQPSQPATAPRASASSPLLAALGYDPATTDEIAARLGWGSADTARQLAELELAGAVVRHCGAWLRV